MFRRILFWSHLSAGVICGLVILTMSVTGVILTYERQLIARAELPMRHATASGVLPEPLPVETLLARVAEMEPGFEPTAVNLASDPLAPAVISAGRSGQRFVDRYTGEILHDTASGIRNVFDTITAWHRWFDASDENRAAARAITGASNIAFLFLLLTGGYLWLPPVFNRVAFRVRILFNPKADNSKARDYNWHHVFGIWSVIPLIVIVVTATVFSYDWANTLLYRAAGDTPPQRGAVPPPAGRSAAQPGTAPAARRPLGELLGIAGVRSPGWQNLTLALPGPADRTVRVSVDHGNGGQPQRRSTLILDAESAALTATETFSSLSPGRQARNWVRFLHTGEALGIVGQTIAGLVSLTSVIMVWTGVALAWRRLVAPLVRRRRLAAGNV